MAVDNRVIESERLLLISMSAAFLEASLVGDEARTANVMGLTIPPEWLATRWLMDIRLKQLQADPSLQPWLLRAIALRQTGEMIGHIGFHSRPGADYLRDIAPGGVEMGYTVYPPFRRQGYAREACAALLDWAYREHGVTRFVLSIRPDNLPSLRIAERLGFHKVGSQVDEDDGPEDVYLREIL